MHPRMQECLGSDWEYLQISKQMNHEFVHRGDETYELILFVRIILPRICYCLTMVEQADERWSPSVIDTKLGKHDAFATNDLFVRHPTKPGLWKIYGRKDDQIMLSTGEKVFFKCAFVDSRIDLYVQTNPGPLGIYAFMLHLSPLTMFQRRFYLKILTSKVPSCLGEQNSKTASSSTRRWSPPSILRMKPN